jgi:hypothetical protein
MLPLALRLNIGLAIFGVAAIVLRLPFPRI